MVKPASKHLPEGVGHPLIILVFTSASTIEAMIVEFN